MKIKDLPFEIRKYVIKEYKRQHPGVTELSKILEKDTDLDIVWSETVEGSHIWGLLHKGKFTKFCRFHGIDVPVITSVTSILKDIISRCETTKRTTKTNKAKSRQKVSSKVSKS
jgi:hypothetical protein